LEKKFRIQENHVIDNKGNEYLMCGNPEIKGINNKERRKYLFDLVHFMPRDLNFPNKESSGCLLRPEVVYSYEIKLIENKMMINYPEEYKKIAAEIKYVMKKSKRLQVIGERAHR